MTNKRPTQKTSKRIPTTPDTFEKFRLFSRGLDASYDETLLLLMSLVEGIDKDPLIAGKEMQLVLDKKGIRRPKKGGTDNG